MVASPESPFVFDALSNITYLVPPFRCSLFIALWNSIFERLNSTVFLLFNPGTPEYRNSYKKQFL